MSPSWEIKLQVQIAFKTTLIIASGLWKIGQRKCASAN